MKPLISMKIARLKRKSAVAPDIFAQSTMANMEIAKIPISTLP
jgi:hypothetical protein